MEENSNKGLWAALIVLLLVAVLFVVLWFLRGGEIDRLNRSLADQKTSADSATRRLESDLQSARSDIESGKRAQSDLEKRLADEKRRATDSSRQLEERMQGLIDSANSRLRDVTAELDKARAGSAQKETETVQNLGREVETLTSRLKEAQARAEDLQGQVGDWKASHSNVGRELETANQELRKLTQAGLDVDQAIAAKQELQSAGATNRELEKRVGDLQAANAKLDREVKSANDTVARLTAAAAAAAAAPAASPAAAAIAAPAAPAIGALQSELKTVQDRLAVALAEQVRLGRENQRIQEEKKTESVAASKRYFTGLEKVRAANSRLLEDLSRKSRTVQEEREDTYRRDADELTRARDAARKEATDAKEKLAAVQKQLQDGDKRWDDLLKASEARRADWEDRYNTAVRAAAKLQADRELELQTQFEKRLAKEKADWQSHQKSAVGAAAEKAATAREDAPPTPEPTPEPAPSASLPQAPEPVPAAGLSQASAPASSAGLPPEAAAEPALVPATVPFISLDPERAVGSIVKMVEDGRTYVINLGSRQGVRPGERFDVHRRVGLQNRYIGLVRVVRTLEDYSWVASVNPGEVKVCPTTGRAVLDPCAEFSPYVLSRDNNGVPLVDAQELGLLGDLPQVGDFIDNPFFQSGHPFVFAFSPEVLRDNPAAAQAVDTLGGRVTSSPERADFLVVRSDPGLFTGMQKPKPVTVSQVMSYVEPGLPK